MSLLVSIHDVTPALEPGVRRLWQMCAARGLAPALLVVPDWLGRHPLQRSPNFSAWLRECASTGAEIILHGERHDPGEFRALGKVAARQRIDRGLRSLRAVGLEPAGFVPPGWRATDGGHAAAGEAGLAFSEDARSIRVHACGRRVASPAVRWSARSSPRAWGSVAVARARWLLQRRAPFVRLAFHPQDYAHPRTARDLASTLDRWLARRRASTYASVCAELRH